MVVVEELLLLLLEELPLSELTRLSVEEVSNEHPAKQTIETTRSNATAMMSFFFMFHFLLGGPPPNLSEAIILF